MPYLTTKTDGEHPLEDPGTPLDGEHAGLTGGPTEEYLAAEKARAEAAPVGVDTVDLTYNADPDPTDHEVDTSDLHPMEVPRHDRYADENTGRVVERVIPGGVTNAHPDFSVDQDGNVGPPATGLTTTSDLATSGGPTEIEVTEPAADGEDVEYVEVPAGNASAEAWREYAIAYGLDPVVAEGMTRNELRDAYTDAG